MKKRKILRERRKRFKILSAVVALVMAVTLAVGLLPDSTGQVFAAEQSADAETRNNYEKSLGDPSSTRYNGRVWSDKSVSTEDVTFTGDNESSAQKITVNKDVSDFLVTFSTLATSTQEEGVSQVPVDVVFVIDNSNSMEEELPDRQTRLEATLDAVNSSIATVMTSNAESRVGVVVYGLEAEVLLPLGHYEPMRDGNYITLSGHRYHPGNLWEAEGYSTEFTASGNHVVSMDPGERGTNTHMGINAGMGLLANAENIGENNMKHVPALILLSDGASTSSGAGDWWNPSGRTGGGTSTANSYALKVAMNAQYNKQQVNLHYGVEDTASDYACKIYTIGMGIEQLRGDDYNRAQMALDPGTHLTDNNDVANAIERVWNNYRNNRNAILDDYRFRHPSTNDITTIAYNDGYYSAENAEDVTDVFDDITSSIVTSRPQVPTEVTGDNPVSDGYITYTDPIGEYMHVDSMKSLIWAGQEFTDYTRTDENGTVTYTFQGEINSPAYGEHNVSEIQIKVTTDQDGQQTLEVKVPASAIPLRVNTIRTNADGTIENTPNNAYPLRLVYGVSQNEDVADENGIIDTKVVSEEYLANNTVNGKVNFYSNLYSGNKQGNTTVGDAKVEFTPAESNPFYFMQEKTPIYLDENGPQGAGQVVEFNSSATYYVPVTYYNGNNQVTTYVGRAASTMIGYVKSDDNGYYIEEGAPRLGNIQQFQTAKADNTTGTAATYIYPTFEGTDVHEGKFVVYLGNNGRMELDAPASLTIAKNVTADSGLTAPDEDFTFVLTAQSKADSTVTAVIHTEGGQDQEVPLVFDANGKAQIQGESSTADITLKDGQSIEIPGMANTEYTVQETSIPAGFTLTGAVANPGSTGTFDGRDTVTGTVGTEDAQITFTNNYSVVPITSEDLNINLGGTKNITGRDFQQGDSYTFTIAPARATPDAPLPQKDGQDVARVTITPDSGSSANFAFDGVITFSKPGEYRYIIQEDTGDLPGVDYDAAIYRLNIVIVDNGDGRLRLAEPDEVTNTAGNLEYPQNPFIQKWGEGEEVNAISFDNSYSATEATVAIQGIKDFQVENSDRRLADGDFTFRIEALGYNTDGSDNFNPIPVGDPAQPMPVSNQASNIANGNVVFGNMTFTQDMIGNIYVYKVTEVLPEGVNAGNPTKDGITYDVNEKIVKVTVTRSDEGGTEHVVATVAPNDGTAERPVNFRFENRYQPESTTIGSGTNAGITVQKTFTGRPWTDSDAFTYEISATGNTAGLETAAMPMPQDSEITIGKPADGAVNTNVFGEMTFEKEGVYTYTITEKSGNLADKGVTYDTHEATVIVTVTEDQTTGTLSAVIAYDNRLASGSDQNVKNAAAFTNTYASSFDKTTAVNLDGTKNLMVGGNSSEQLEANEFYFVVTPLENAPVGDAILGENGSYLVGNSAGSDEDGDKTFTASIDQLLNNIRYSQADLGGTMSKDFVYIITEQIPRQSSAGVTYDHTAYQVTVTVTDNGEGNLRASKPVIKKGAWDGVSFEPDADQDGVNSVVFNNSYNPAQTAIAPHWIKKILSGDRTEGLQAGEFSFTMSIVSANPQDGVQLPAATTIGNEADGTIQFGDITFTKAGTYIIQVKEDRPENAIDNGDGTYTLDGVTYDDHVIQTTFTVRDQRGQLIVNRANTSGSQTFTNEYQAEGTLEGATALEVTKELTGRDWQEGDTFTFTLETANDITTQAVEDGTVVLPDNAAGIQISYDDEEKTASFGDITFEKQGDYVFVVRETPGTIGGMTYDGNSRYIIVHAEDQNNGTLEVTYSVMDGTDADAQTTDLVFENHYNPDQTTLPGAANLKVEKIFTGRPGNEWLDTDSFTFTLAADMTDPDTAEAVNSGEIILPQPATLTINKENNVSAAFGDITFTKAGNYQFIVTESDAGSAGITYDTKPRIILVNVEDNKDGTMTASVDERSDELRFTNTYDNGGASLSGETALKVTKSFTGRSGDVWLDTDAFTFELSVDPDDETTADAVESGVVVLPENKEVTVTKNAQTAVFGDITFSEEGTYKFVVSEQNGGIPGVAYDETVKHIEVQVTDNDNGTMTAAVSIDGTATSEMTFTNTYSTTSATLDGAANLKVWKELTGRDWQEGDSFTFTLTGEADRTGYELPDNASGITIAYDENDTDAEKSANFGDITFTEPGIYEFTVAETEGDIGGIDYDDTQYVVTVEVSDQNDGTLKAEVTGIVKADGTAADSLSFTNTYEPGGTVQPGTGDAEAQLTKELVGRDWLESDQFSFTITADEGTPAETLPEETTVTVGKPESGNSNTFDFGPFTFNAEGEYHYTVREEGAGTTVNGITYSNNVAKITIDVTDDLHGGFAASVTITNETFTNTYSAGLDYGAEGGLNLVKRLDGHDIAAGQFQFQVTPVSGEGYVSAEDAAKKAGIEESGLTVSTDAASMVDGVAVDSIALFNQMKFDQTDNGKTYAYQISEVQETKAGYEYDKTTYTVTISVSDDNNGVLTVTTVVSNGTDSTAYVYTSEDGQNTPAQVVFNNTYDGAGSLGGEGAVSIQADKELLNGQLSGNDFTFIVTDKNEAEVTRGTNDASGKITFNEVQYTTDKLIADLASGAASYDADSSTYTYQYEVTEDTSGFQDMGVIANVAHFNITVTVKDNGDGTLTTAVDYGQYGDGLTFQNTYGTGADIVVNVGGTKELAHADGLTPPDITGAYQFIISGQDENGNAAPLPENTTASNDANGNVSFGAIQYTMENVFGTTAGETASDDAAAGEDGIDTQIAQRTKTYTYTVTESGNVAGVTNDQEASKTFTIVVTDNGDGTLSVTDGAGNTVVPGAQFTFVNTYSVTPSTSTPTGDGGITITKNLEGRALNEGEFTFEMTGLAGTISEGMAVTGSNDAAGNVALGGLEFSRPGTYEFRISEVIPETPAGGVTYDGMTYQATAEVTDNHDGTLAVAWTVKAAADGEALEQVTFTNAYKAAPAGVQFGALKRLDGDARDLKAGEFTFQVKDESGKVVATAKNKADGSVRFDSITFDKAGTYTYTISEVKGSDETITYDETVYTAIVNVTDDLNGQLYASVTAGDGSALKMTFTNKYTKPAVPVEPDEGPTAVRTGDTAPILPIILVMAAALAAIIAAAAVILRRNRRQ